MKSVTSIASIRNAGNMSRYQMVDWINGQSEEEVQITRIEDLCTGVAYCCMMNTIFPESIKMKRVKMMPKGERDYEHNLRLLQAAFNYLELDYPVPIDLLIQGRFKHNFEFLQFFKKFYDSQTLQREIAGVVPRMGGEMAVIEEETMLEEPEDNEEMEEMDDAKQMQAELLEKIIRARDFAYNKLVMIEQMIAQVDKDEEYLQEFSRNINIVLWAPRNDEDQDGNIEDGYIDLKDGNIYEVDGNIDDEYIEAMDGYIDPALPPH